MEPFIIERSEHPISRRDIDPNVLKVLYRLINAGHIAYLVGGGVRDLMVGRRPKDFDVATSAHPHQVRDLFRNSRLIGRRFRLVHVFFGPQNIEVATFRRLSEDVADSDDLLIRHDNTFGTPEEDAFRRDFTINSLFYDPRTFRVIDYVGGVQDLQSRLIRTIGEPQTRMREDPVRMLRAVRFAVKMGFELDPATQTAIETHRDDLAKASVPRLVEETFRTLAVAEPERALVLLEQLGLLPAMLPGISEHLKSSGASLAETPTVRNLAALGATIAEGNVPSRGLVLACLFADLHLDAVHNSARARHFELVEMLRGRGFSRADTEHMRLLLEALPHMLRPSRITRRVSRRPYFAEARRLFALIAPVRGADIAALDRFLAEAPRTHQPALHPHHAPQGPV
ncbi:MAG TPA: polynucleotide adenylyltransferase PcnB, partial [Candidatus Binataceae bacterium]|nr:polynucleotide adenylyltransferase PcnB [Candidatus Binataceae bacterium]